eukprot:CAMPEP_0202456970 /NCGR_PEP_ID=MMETSP1360-20130828/14107_1 /ASSEMBLY_ACC=CAM_ASM_000848 /TAXON_ID=515479 /ORGANISM="Licmophora paradoxa, Strain CCMP2313" /LENGTH=156 /DNA_ID=CAMNT_0049076933 /DNA_START=6 /DNA_END=472 /DNA_ORIENTATION=+
MVTTKEAREFREMKEQEIEKNLAEQKRAAKEEARRQRREEKIQRREMRAKALAEKKIEAKCEMKKKFPKNMENWREVAFLMTELARIKKEEKLWNEASLYLDEQEKEILALEEQAGAHFNGDDTVVIDVSTDAKIYDERLSQAVESLVLSTRRIGR